MKHTDQPALAPQGSRWAQSDTGRLVRRQPILVLVILFVLALLTIFVVLPIISVLRLGILNDQGQFTLEYLREILTKQQTWITLKNSLELGAIAALISTLIGFVFAFAITRTEMIGKKVFRLAATLPIISPPFVLSLSIIFLFGRQGVITNGLLGIEDFNVYGIGSLIIVQVLSFFPIAFLTMTGILDAIDDSVEDAAFSMGASRWQIFRTVTLPLAIPGIASALLLVFIQSVEDFSNPAVLSGEFSTLAVEVYRIITGQYDMHSGSLMAFLLLIPTLLAFSLQRFWLKDKSFVTITGKPTQKRRKIHEAHIVWPLFAFCALITGFIILFYGTVVAASLVQAWGVDFTFTLDHYKYVFGFGWGDLRNTLILACISAPIGGLLGMIIAYFSTRKKFFGKKYMQFSSLLSFAIPGTVLGIGYLNTFNTPPLVLTGGAVILIAAFVFRNIPVAIESATSTLMQVDGSIEEASTILGAKDGTTFRNVLLPLLRQAFFSGLVYSFVRAVTAVSTIIFLISPAWSLATTRVFSLFEASQYSDAAAYVTIMIVIIITVILLLNYVVQLILAPKKQKK